MTKKSFIKTIGSKGLLADYNTEGKKLQTEDSIDQTYSSTSTKAQSGVAVNEAFKTRETSTSDDSYTYIGMKKSYGSADALYWKLVSFNAVNNYWTLQFEVDVSNGRKGNNSYDTEIYETKRLTICGINPGDVTYANELRYAAQGIDSSRGYSNNIYYEIGSDKLVTVYIKAINRPNKTQICRLTSLRNFQGISNITWHEATENAGTQPTNPVKFKEAFPAIASTSSNIGSDSVPVYVNNGRPVVCNSSNLKAGKDDDGNVIKNTYATKTELSTHTEDTTVHITEDERTAWNAKQAALTAGDNVTIADNVISSNQVFVATYGTTTYQEIKDAYDAGKICLCKDSNNLFALSIVNNSYVLFTLANGWADKMYVNTCYESDNRWVRGSNGYQRKLTFDTTPTAGSNNPVTSDGIKTALDSRVPAPTSTTGTQVLKCINGVIQWVNE